MGDSSGARRGDLVLELRRFFAFVEGEEQSLFRASGRWVQRRSHKLSGQFMQGTEFFELSVVFSRNPCLAFRRLLDGSDVRTFTASVVP